MRKMFFWTAAWTLAGGFLWAQTNGLQTQYGSAWNALRTKNKREPQKVKSRPATFTLREKRTQTPGWGKPDRYYPIHPSATAWVKSSGTAPNTEGTGRRVMGRDSKRVRIVPGETTAVYEGRAVTAWAPGQKKKYQTLYQDPSGQLK